MVAGGYFLPWAWQIPTDQKQKICFIIAMRSPTKHVTISYKAEFLVRKYLVVIQRSFSYYMSLVSSAGEHSHTI